MVQLAPLSHAEKLSNHAVQHGTAPDHGLIAGIEQAHGEHFEAGYFDGDDPLIHGGQRLLGGAEHDGDVGTIDVGIEETDFLAEMRERQREIYGDCGFAYAAFAAGDGYELFYAGD